MDNIEEDDILTIDEEKQIEILKADAIKDIQAKAQAKAQANAQEKEVFDPYHFMSAAIKMNMRIDAISSKPTPLDFSITRRLGLHPIVTIYNISGKKAWIILSPAPITTVTSVGVEKVGAIGLSSVGDYKCQQSALSNNSTREFELDNSQIYYSVFFDCDGKWRTPFKNRRINTRKYDINLLQRHVDDSIDSDFVPSN